MLLRFLALCLCLFQFSFADNLPAALAFQTSVSQVSKDRVMVHFMVTSGYDLYRDKIHITAADYSKAKIGLPVLPGGAIMEHSDELGDYEVYRNSVDVLVPVSEFGDNELTLDISYQGCKTGDYCFPEMNETKTLTLDPKLVGDAKYDVIALEASSADNMRALVTENVTTPASDTLAGFVSSSNSAEVSHFFEHGMVLILVGFFVVGLLIAFTPCVFPMLPILLAIVVGKNLTTRRTFILASSYVIGSACSYALAGVLATVFGESLQVMLQNNWVNGVLVLLFILLSLSMFGLFELQMPAFMRNKLSTMEDKKQSVFSVFITGAISTLVLSPCVTAPLAGALLYISTTGNVVLGGSALFVMGLGAGIPLLILAVFGNKLLPKNGMWMTYIKQFLGFLMLGMAIYLTTRLFDAYVVYILSGIWLISLAIFLFKPNLSKSVHFAHLLATVLFLLGATLLVNQAWSILSPEQMHTTVSSTKLDFVTVTNIADLDKKLLEAKEKNMPVMIDYSAQWCVACKEMDAKTFTNPEVVNLLKSFILLRADLTDNNDTAKALQHKYDVFAPPSLVIISKNGDVHKMVTGFIEGDKLIPILDGVSQGQ